MYVCTKYLYNKENKQTIVNTQKKNIRFAKKKKKEEIDYLTNKEII